jgi:hypothetical protein
MGDVGQDAWEEINYEPAGQGGNNYGWKRFEGFSQFSATPLAYGPATSPLFVYNHVTGVTVLGGRVYRGLELGADFFGRYFFGEFSFEKLWSMVIVYDPAKGRYVGRDLRDHSPELGHPTIGHVSSIDVDSYGEIYLVDYSGKVTKLGRTNTTWLTAFTVTTGKVVSGSLRHVVVIDDRSMTLEPPIPTADDIVSTYIGKTNRPAPTTLTFDAVGRVSPGATGLLRLLVRRWSDNQWVQVRAENMNGTRRRFRVSGLSAADYVRAGDGRIEIRLSVHKKVPTAGPFRAYWDQVVARAD